MSTNIQPLHMMSPGANLEAYIQVVNTIPLLTPEEERELAIRLFKDGDLDAARALVMAHLRFVVYIAKSYSGYGLAEADLIQEGNVGLMKAVRRFNPEFGVRLVSFAVHWIKAEMHEFIRGSKKRLGWMNDKEVKFVAAELGVEPHQVRQMEGRLSAHDEAFDSGLDEEDEFLSPSRYLEDSESDPARIFERQSSASGRQSQLALAFASLDDRAKHIIQQRWLQDSKATLHELAEYFGISAERVRQLEKNAIKKLRQQFEL
jgi:RNA polymerase sigma-32 factor